MKMKRLIFFLAAVLLLFAVSCNQKTTEVASAQRIDQIGDVVGEFSAVSISDTATQNFLYDKVIPYQGSLFVYVFVDTIDTPAAFVTRLQTAGYVNPTEAQWMTRDSVAVDTLQNADTVYVHSLSTNDVVRWRLQYFQSDGVQSNRVKTGFKIAQNR